MRFVTLVTWRRSTPSKEDRVRPTSLTHILAPGCMTRCGQRVGLDGQKRWEGRFPREDPAACVRCSKYVQ